MNEAHNGHAQIQTDHVAEIAKRQIAGDLSRFRVMTVFQIAVIDIYPAIYGPRFSIILFLEIDITDRTRILPSFAMRQTTTLNRSGCAHLFFEIRENLLKLNVLYVVDKIGNLVIRVVHVVTTYIRCYSDL
jgi:hypothetical protein